MAFKPPNTVLQSVIPPAIKTALIDLLIIIVTTQIMRILIFFALCHELCESLVDHRLIFVVFIEDKVRKLAIMDEQIFEAEENVSATIVKCITSGL